MIKEDKTKKSKKAGKSILQRRLGEEKIKVAVKKYNEKELLKKLKKFQKLTFYFKKYLKIGYIFFVNFRLYNYLIYGFCIMMILTLFDYNISIEKFIVGISTYISYSLITEDWRKE